MQLSQELSADAPWVVFRLRDQHFAISAYQVQEMLPMPEITSLPNAPQHVRGMINLRGRVIPLLDLRSRLRMKSYQEEVGDLEAMLEERRQDHIHWIAELEKSVSEKRKFTLATDPHQCAFGKWYDGYETDNLELLGALQKFSSPHAKVHRIAIEVEELRGHGHDDQALALINRTRGGALARMMLLFDEVKEAVRKAHREIALVTERDQRNLALAVDAVESVEPLAPGTLEKLDANMGELQDPLITMIGRRQQGDEMVLVVDPSPLLREAGAQS